MINPANRIKSIELSQIRKMFEITNPDAINLGIGEPDFDVPENIKNAMKQSEILRATLPSFFVRPRGLTTTKLSLPLKTSV